MINLLLAEDHLLVRAALAHLINSFQGIHVVAEGACGHEILDAARIHPVDVALIDAALLPIQDWNLVHRLKTVRPGINILVTSSYRSDRYVDRLMEAGACGFVHKNAAVSELEIAIRQAAASRRVHYPGVDVSGNAGPAPSSVPALTRRQREILKLIVEGCRSRTIAERLDLSVKTVEAHRREIMRRVGKQNSAGLVKEAIRLGLVPFPT
nr:Response regulator UvrY [Virgibacillus halodenitrificans]